MKKIQLKDTFRNILKEKVSFLSIAIIAVLAVAAYLGINFASEAMRENADNFYRTTNFRDLEITSTMMLGEEDIESLSELPEVKDVEGVYSVNGKVTKDSGSENVSIVSLTQRINTMEIVEGRLPEKEKECAVESDLADITGVKVGETITVTDSHGECPEYLKENTFEITAIVYHADLYTLKNQAPGNRYIVVLPSVFDKDALSDSYMKAVVRLDKPEGISYFDKDYRSLALSAKDSVEEWSKGREANRREKFKEILEEKLDEPKKELADAEKKLEDAKSTLDEKKKEVEDGEEALKEGKTKLDDSAAKLAESEEELKKGDKELADAATKLNEAKAELDKTESQLESSKEELDKSWTELNGAKTQLDSTNSQLVETYNQAETLKDGAREQLKGILSALVKDLDVNNMGWSSTDYISEAGSESLSLGDFYVFNGGPSVDRQYWGSGSAESLAMGMLKGTKYESYFPAIKDYVNQSEGFAAIAEKMAGLSSSVESWDAGKTQYIKSVGEYNSSYSQYQGALTQYKEGLNQYNAGLSDYNTGIEEYNANKSKLDEGWAEYDSGKAEYEKKTAEYEEKVKELEDGKAALKDGEEDYNKALADLEDAKEELAEAEQKLEDLQQCHFVTLDTRGNGPFVYADDSAVNIGKLGKTFALLFVLLGALVIYATVGRIIDEQRALVGTQKALGFFSGEVFKKHLAFGVVATCIGILLGIVICYFLVEPVVISANEQFYVMKHIPEIIQWSKVGIILILGIILSGFAVFWACSHLLKQTAKSLMQPPAPKGMKKTEKKSAGGSLYSRLIVRNMLVDWTRVLITMASVAGCCALLVIGFTLKNSILDSVDRQFDDIIRYDDKIYYDLESFESAEEEIEKVLKDSNIDYMKISSRYHSISSPDGLTAAELLVVDSDRTDDFLSLRDPKTKETVPVSKEGIVITRRISETYGISEGDSITLYNSNMDPYETKVSGITQYYFGKVIVISKEEYANLFGEEVECNAFLTKGDYSEETLQDDLSEIKGFESVTSTESERERYADSTASLQSITLLLILAAGMMAYFVLLNLINMYLNQKKTELTIMRVNGFTTKEVIRYVGGESLLTTILGIILGLIIGAILGYSIVRFLEQAQFGLVTHVNYPAFIYSALMTGLFALIINYIALRKIKHLKLSDIA